MKKLILPFSISLLFYAACSKKTDDTIMPAPTPSPVNTNITGKVTTIAGSGSFGLVNGAALNATFIYPQTIGIDDGDRIYIGHPSAIFNGRGALRNLSGANVLPLQFYGHPIYYNGIYHDMDSVAIGNPSSMCVNNNEIYICNRDFLGRQFITKLSPAAGTASTLAGVLGVGVFPPVALAVGEYYDNVCVFQNIIYVADGSRIRKLGTTSIIDFVGNTSFDYADGSGTAARFNGIAGICADATGNLFVLETTAFGRIRKVTPTGIVTTFVIPSTEAILTNGGGLPGNICIDKTSNTIYVTDPNGHRVMKITSTGVISTLAGKYISGLSYPGDADGTGTTAQFKFPLGICFKNNKLYVADQGNNKIKLIE